MAVQHPYYTYPSVVSATGSELLLVLQSNAAKNMTVAQVLAFGRTPVSDWLTPIVSWPVPASYQTILSQEGKVALTVGSLASMLPISYNSTQTTIGVASFVVNDVASRFLSTYAYYGEARVNAGAQGTSFGMELDAINFGTQPTSPSTPYHQLYDGSAVGVWSASGGGLTGVQDAQVALAVVENGAKFLTGLSFGATSLTGSDGVSGFGQAISLAKGHQIQWYAPGGSIGLETCFITSTVTTDAKAVSMQFQDGGTVFLQPGNGIGFSVQTVASTANGITVQPNTTGLPPVLKASGTDTNIDLGLMGQGTGVIATGASIQPSSGVTIAMLLTGAQDIVWQNSGGNQVAALLSTNTSGASFSSVTFTNSGISLGTQTYTIASFGLATSAVNFLGFLPAATGGSPSITAEGTDTDINIGLFPKGAGVIATSAVSASSANTGGGTALPANPVGYIPIIFNGTARKLPYYAV